MKYVLIICLFLSENHQLSLKILRFLINVIVICAFCEASVRQYDSSHSCSIFDAQSWTHAELGIEPCMNYSVLCAGTVFLSLVYYAVFQPTLYFLDGRLLVSRFLWHCIPTLHFTQCNFNPSSESWLSSRLVYVCVWCTQGRKRAFFCCLLLGICSLQIGAWRVRRRPVGRKQVDEWLQCQLLAVDVSIYQNLLQQLLWEVQYYDFIIIQNSFNAFKLLIVWFV